MIKRSVEEHEKRLAKMIKAFNNDRLAILAKIAKMDKHKKELDLYDSQIQQAKELGRNFFNPTNFKIGV